MAAYKATACLVQRQRALCAILEKSLKSKIFGRCQLEAPAYMHDAITQICPDSDLNTIGSNRPHPLYCPQFLQDLKPRLHGDSDPDPDPDWLRLYGGKLDSNPDSDHLSHVDRDPDSNPDSGPGARVKVATAQLREAPVSWKAKVQQLIMYTVLIVQCALPPPHYTQCPKYPQCPNDTVS